MKFNWRASAILTRTYTKFLTLSDWANLCDRYGAARTFFGYDYNGIPEEVTAAWNKVGITVNTKAYFGNEYFLNGKKISRSEAIKFACQKYGKNLNDMPGDYNF